MKSEETKKGVSRRFVLKSSAAALASGLSGVADAIPRLTAQKPRIVVVGAGVFGGWTALDLLRRGAKVTLVDAWGPGNSRASSGGETRVIRASYGGQRVYTEMVARALVLWRENEKRWNRRLYYRCGALRLRKDDSYGKRAMPILRDAGLDVEELTPPELSKRFPQINFEGVGWAVYEKDAGYLLARRACQEVLAGFLAEGGEYRQLAVKPTAVTGPLTSVTLSDGSSLSADQFVFACGPWLSELFPDAVRIRPTRQEVFYFGTPRGDHRFLEDSLPCWLDGATVPGYYGIPGCEWRGLKVAGGGREVETVDPTSLERVASKEMADYAREYMEFRFPRMKGAPLVETRVCQYEASPDGNFIIDRHPKADNVWIVGGGSGHGFKHGPAMGERVAQTVLGEKPVDPVFSLSRF